MRPLEHFLAERHPEVMTAGKTFILGDEYEFRNPDRKALRKLVKAHYAAGQSALKGFRRWLTRTEGKPDGEAAKIAATVWNTLCMTYDVETQKASPMKLLDRDNDTYSYSTKTVIVHGLRFWARYNDDSQLQEATLLWLRRKPETAPQYVLDALEESPPYTNEEYRELLKALESFKGAPRFPWAWSCLRIVLVCGVSLREVAHLERARITQALNDGHIKIRAASGKFFRVVSIEPIREELKMLLAFPWEWGIIADLLNPARTLASPERGNAVAIAPLRQVSKLVFKRAGVEQTNNWPARVRWSAGWQYYRRTNNLVGTAQILGFLNLSTVSQFIEELKRREAPIEETEEPDAEEPLE